MSGGAGFDVWLEDPWAPPAPRAVLPAGLATMPPGAELGAVLEGIDRDELNGHELVEVLKAQARQIAHPQAGFYANIVEMAHTPWGDADSEAERMPIPDEMALHELRPALGITRRAAEIHFDVAFSLARLPQVLEALDRGVIDLPRAKVLCTETEHLTVEEAHHIVNEILGDAARLTTGQLGARLRKRCLEYDPDSARRRYHRGLEHRRVEGGQNPDGTADLLARRILQDRHRTRGEIVVTTPKPPVASPPPPRPATSSPATSAASSPAAGSPPPPPRSTPPTPTTSADPPTNTTSDPSATETTNPSNTKAAGPSPNPNPATSTGPAPAATATRSDQAPRERDSPPWELANPPR